MNNFNAWLWEIINTAGWWWWAPCVVIAIKNMVWLSLLNAPVTGMGRIARTLAWLAHIPMMFAPFFNAMGSLSLPLLLIANNILYIQLWLACRDQKAKMQINPKYGAAAVLRTMVATDEQMKRRA